MPLKTSGSETFSLEEWNRSSLQERYERPAKKVVYVEAPAVRSMSMIWDIIRYAILVVLAAAGAYSLISDRSRMLLYETLIEALYQMGI